MDTVTRTTTSTRHTTNAPARRRPPRPSAPVEVGTQVQIRVHAWNHDHTGSHRMPTDHVAECTVTGLVWDDWTAPGEWSVDIEVIDVTPELAHLLGRRAPASDIVPDSAVCPDCLGTEGAQRHLETCIEPNLIQQAGPNRNPA